MAEILEGGRTTFLTDRTTGNESDREFVEFTIIDNRDVKGRNG